IPFPTEATVSRHLAIALVLGLGAGPVAAQTREKASDDRPVAELIRGLREDRDPADRARAADALRQRGEDAREAAAALTEALADVNRMVRGGAALALWHVERPAVKQVLPGLLIARNDADEAVRAAAAEAWAEIGPGVRAALPFLKRSLAAGRDP